ncbi:MULTISPECIES: hypothetical protein [Thalassospira]|jgi:hypothetical protein|uniref:hypothetical protein n=1 Tax=Thalassospira TaxID=168934 RepID=UPI0007A60947|nr:MULTISPECIES: hypothetical protein [Thalassospira]MAL30823.1 hypothetical protein [Thalassospira sp.]MBR9781423.1 hypothetical protein [Rhodospirillales bacterium]KZD07990.1 hypothetical protein AUP45_17065 [Thalassospira xiamenensis]MBL4843689.1 hypothetical protein [Thalassospira sp.]MBR9817915.1 hypothetical protein [Rhodospirillales bacterium]|tara:strand:- start:851 stop:1051 length:201 start_codon:yes stop_codon:yes gene_type:complete
MQSVLVYIRYNPKLSGIRCYLQNANSRANGQLQSNIRTKTDLCGCQFGTTGRVRSTLHWSNKQLSA